MAEFLVGGILMNTYSEFLGRAEKFFSGIKDESGLTTLADIRDLRAQDRFRVCIVGGFSKGKTRLVNKLLNTDILPETITPTTSLLTEISYGEQPAMTFHGVHENSTYELNHENLNRFSVGGDHADSAGLLSIRMPADFLRPATLLYDTPGVDDVLTERANVTFSALDACDAAIVAISAISPLSLTERTFINRYLQNRAIPRIALVLTFLDKIERDELEEQIDFITSKALAIYPKIEIWYGQNICISANNFCHTVGVDAIRKRLQKWSTLPDIKDLRDRRDLVRIKNAVQNAVKQQQILFSNIQGNREHCRQSLSLAYDALDGQSREWLDIRKRFMDSGTVVADALRKHITDITQSMLNDLRQNSSESFANDMRVNIKNLYTQLASDMQKLVESDIQTLSHDLKDRFGIDPVISLKPIREIRVNEELFPNLQDDSLNGIGQVLLDYATKLFETVIQNIPGASPVRVVLAALVKKILEFGREKLGVSPEEKQKQMENTLVAFCNQFKSQIDCSVQSIYESVADSIRDQQITWINTQRNSLNEIQELDNLQQTVNHLSETIKTGIQLEEDMQNAIAL